VAGGRSGPGAAIRGGFGGTPPRAGGTTTLPQGTTGGFGGPGGAGGAGGLLGGSTPSAELVALLSADSSSYTWVAAAVGSNNASGYQLATGLPVMAIGGFNGSDPSPTLAQFQQYVADGDIHYFAAGGAGGGMGGGPAGGMGGGPGAVTGGTGTGTQISAWVAASFTQVTIGGSTFYDLTQPLTSSGSSATTSTQTT
jgi:hypothetical protein